MIVEKVFIELNDAAESVICVNDIVSIEYMVRDSCAGLTNSLYIIFRHTSAENNYYNYKNMDILMNDLRRIKYTIENHLAKVYVTKDNNLYTKGDYNYADNN